MMDRIEEAQELVSSLHGKVRVAMFSGEQQTVRKTTISQAIMICAQIMKILKEVYDVEEKTGVQKRIDRLIAERRSHENHHLDHG